MSDFRSECLNSNCTAGNTETPVSDPTNKPSPDAPAPKGADHVRATACSQCTPSSARISQASVRDPFGHPTNVGDVREVVAQAKDDIKDAKQKFEDNKTSRVTGLMTKNAVVNIGSMALSPVGGLVVGVVNTAIDNAINDDGTRDISRSAAEVAGGRSEYLVNQLSQEAGRTYNALNYSSPEVEAQMEQFRNDQLALQQYAEMMQAYAYDQSGVVNPASYGVALTGAIPKLGPGIGWVDWALTPAGGIVDVAKIGPPEAPALPEPPK